MERLLGPKRSWGSNMGCRVWNLVLVWISGASSCEGFDANLLGTNGRSTAISPHIHKHSHQQVKNHNTVVVGWCSVGR